MVKVMPYKTYFQLPYRIYLSIDRRFSNNKFYKEGYLKMARVENDLDIYYKVGNTNTKIQDNEIAAIMKNRNSAGWRLISTSTAMVEILETYSQTFIYLGKDKIIDTLHICAFPLKILQGNHSDK